MYLGKISKPRECGFYKIGMTKKRHFFKYLYVAFWTSRELELLRGNIEVFKRLQLLQFVIELSVGKSMPWK
jgi:hypothetical protein